MFQEPLSLYKMIILHMLGRVDFPLTKAQVMNFVLEREYMSFLALQQAMGELVDEHFMRVETYGNRSHLLITAEGLDTLSHLGHLVGAPMQAEIDEFFRSAGLEMRNEVSVFAHYQKSGSGEFIAHLVAKDKDVKLVELSLSVPDEETAKEICANWQLKHPDIYKYLVEALF